MDLTLSLGIFITLTLLYTESDNKMTGAVRSSTKSTPINSTKKNTIVIYDKEIISFEDYLVKISDEGLKNMTRLLIGECPDTDFCGYLVKDLWKSRYGCCISCSCGVSCHVTQSCCPHVLHELARSNSTLKATHYTCEFAAILNRDERVFGEEYYFYTSCPADADRQTKEACEKKVDNAAFAFEDVTPVTDRINKVNYFNRHCAACNGVPVENQKFWTPQIGCEYPPNVQDWSDLMDRIWSQDDCKITFDPPKGVDTNLTLCSSEIISECNVTGRWASYDRKLDFACHQFPMRYRFDTLDQGRKTYRNVFCAFCNGVDVHRNIAFADCATMNVERLFALFVSVSVPTKPVQEHNTCDNGLIYDPLLNRCQNLHCTKPLILVSHEHTCTNLMEYITFAIYAIPFRVSLSEDILSFGFANVIEKLLLNTILKLCECVIHAFFKLEQPYKQKQILSSSLPIREVFLLVSVVVRYATPQREFQRLVNAFTNTSIKLNDTILSVSYGTIDGTIQTPQRCANQEHSTSVPQSNFLWLDNSSLSPVISFEDPYDHMTIVDDIQYQHYCNLESQLYDSGFLNCSAFMYDIDEIGLERVPRGLAYKEEIFEFGHFQSINESHVLVCVDAVKAMFAISMGSRQGICDTLLILICVKVFNTWFIAL